MEWGKFSTKVSFLVTHLLLNHKVVKKPGYFLIWVNHMSKQSGRKNVWLRWPGWFLARILNIFCHHFLLFLKTKPKELASHIQSPSLVTIASGLAPGEAMFGLNFILNPHQVFFFLFKQVVYYYNNNHQHQQEQEQEQQKCCLRSVPPTPKNWSLSPWERARKKDQNLDSRNQPPFLGDFPSRLFAVSW